MKDLRVLLSDPKRSQRGSVLSGVLIMTAFIAILSAALMTALSTNFLLSRTLVNRVANEATVNSAVEMSISQLQATQLNSPCPSLAPVTLNNRTAVPTYSGCWPTVDVRSPQFRQIASSGSPFTIDGAHGQVNSLNDYVVGSSGGTFYDFTFGNAFPRWILPLGGGETGPPLAMRDPNVGGQYLDLLPLSGAPCSSSPYCVGVRTDNGSASPPPFLCSIGLGAPVVTRPAASPTNAGFGYYAYGPKLEATIASSGGHVCDWEATASVPSGQPVVAGPVAFHCTSACSSSADEVYVVASDLGSSRLYWYRFQSSSLTLMGSLSFPWGEATGIAVSSGTLPARAAINFDGGQVALVQIASTGTMTLVNTAVLSNVDLDADPYWCTQCGNVVGMGGADGVLYLFDSSLTLSKTFSTGSSIRTTPAADGAGNWYVATDDGYVHELQVQGSSLTRVKSYGPMGQFGSSAQVGACPAGICLYLGGQDSKAYLVQLDARDAVIWACISTAPPACSGSNPRVWAQVEIGVAGNSQTVHVQGWSYYSP